MTCSHIIMAVPNIRYILSLYSVFADVFSLWASATCYYPNGSDANAYLPQDEYQSSDGGDKFSMCCALNKSRPNLCRSDGLCQSTIDQFIWRESCTDPYWKSPSCIKLCVHGTGKSLNSIKKIQYRALKDRDRTG